MKLKYIGTSFGIDELTNGKTYIATIGDDVFFRVFDDSGEDYLYSRVKPKPLYDSEHPGGKWVIVEDMTEEEKELDKKFQDETENFNDLVKKSTEIAARYAQIYKDEIEANIKY